ncbi:MAG: protein kinase, partial [Planctomycetota bacterium]|nr:protein kinase [Planctomycetota bacterium]
SHTGQALGTPAYMAPEQAEGKAKLVGPRSDVYSLGAILYEMLAGRPPFVGENALQVMRTALHEEPVPPRVFTPGVPRDLETICLKCLEKEPGRRYASAGEFADDLKAFQHDEPISARPVGAAERAWKKVRKNPTAYCAGSLAALALLGAVLSYLSSRLEQSKAQEAQRQADASRLAELEAKERQREMERQRAEAWEEVCRFDFSKETCLPDDFEIVLCRNPVSTDRPLIPVPGAAEVKDGALTLQGVTSAGGGLVMARWRRDVGEDIRLEVEVDDDRCAGVSIAGDSLNGYRATLDLQKAQGQSPLELDTVATGSHRILARSRKAVNHSLPTHTVRFEKIGQDLRVELDGERRIAYFAPVPYAGKGQRNFSLSTYWTGSRFRRLVVWRRRGPEVVSVLDEGRGLLRRKQFEAAEEFFREKADEFAKTNISAEASLLLGLTLAAQAKQDEALSALNCVLTSPLLQAQQGMDEDKASYVRSIILSALNEKARLLDGKGDFEGLIEVALQANRSDPESQVAGFAAEMCVQWLRRQARSIPEDPDKGWTPRRGPRYVSKLESAMLAKKLSALAELPVDELDLSQTGISDLSPLAHAKAHGISLPRNSVSDLSPIKGLPLERLSLGDNDVSDLSPLRGMNLRLLELHRNRVSDLSPLRGVPLFALRISENNVSDLSPLKGMSLTKLHCGQNSITDLSPLAGMLLGELDCARNFIKDLSPLRQAPLGVLMCWDNEIEDLSPLRGMPLFRLWAYNNHIKDLSPLEGMQLSELNCASNEVTDVGPLTRSRLVDLDLANNRVGDLSPLHRLKLTRLIAAGNRISEISPLRGMPLTELYIDGNQVSDLSPLAEMKLTGFDCSNSKVTDLSVLDGMPLRRLGIERVPLGSRNADIVARLPLVEITVDLLDERAVQLTRRIPSLQHINAHRRDYTLSMADDLMRSLRGQPADLRKYAFEVDGYCYLAVPHRMRWQAAESFAGKQGARLACPATFRKLVRLCDALRRYCTNDANYLIGAILDPKTGTFRWVSGEAWSDLGFLNESARRGAYRMGGVGLSGYPILAGDYGLVWAGPDDERLPVLEWEGSGAKDGNAPLK